MTSHGSHATAMSAKYRRNTDLSDAANVDGWQAVRNDAMRATAARNRDETLRNIVARPNVTGNRAGQSGNT